MRLTRILQVGGLAAAFAGGAFLTPILPGGAAPHVVTSTTTTGCDPGPCPVTLSEAQQTALILGLAARIRKNEAHDAAQDAAIKYLYTH